MGLGRVKVAAAREHVVSFSSVQQNEQMVVVVEPGRLGVELDQASLSVSPGKTVALLVHVRRGKSLRGPAKLELIVPRHISGLTADAVEIPAGQSDATIRVRFARGSLGPFNMPILVRGTLMENDRPVIGEAKLEILPAE
jgi:hypothetical protein